MILALWSISTATCQAGSSPPKRSPANHGGKSKGFPLERLPQQRAIHPLQRSLMRMPVGPRPQQSSDNQAACAESLISTEVSWGSKDRNRWGREPIAFLGYSASMGGPALSLALLCLGRRGCKLGVYLLATGRQPAPLSTIIIM